MAEVKKAPKGAFFVLSVVRFSFGTLFVVFLCLKLCEINPTYGPMESTGLMDHLSLYIKEKLGGLQMPVEFAQVISDLGFDLIDGTQLDSDELIWKIARDFWKSAPTNFEEQVSTEFHKITEQL